RRSKHAESGAPLQRYTKDVLRALVPHVAGVAALVLSKHPSYTVEEVRQILRVSTDDALGAGFDLQSGFGRLNARKAGARADVLQAKILGPANASPISGSVSVQGMARGTNFDHYTLEYGPGDLPASWQTIRASNSPVSGGELALWDTGPLPDGLYTLRLRAYNHAGEAFEDRSSLVVDYASIDSPAPPRIPNLTSVYKPGVILPILGKALGATFQGFRVRYAQGLQASTG